MLLFVILVIGFSRELFVTDRLTVDFIKATQSGEKRQLVEERKNL